jgi:lycopene cyclase-like protein
VQHFAWGSRLLTSTGGVDAGLVVDASGASSCLTVRPPAAQVPAVQAAWGLVARFDQPPGPPGACVLMDWSGTDEDDPTFLYAIDLGDGTWLAEETSLARRPALDLDALRRRLDTRLRSAGAEPGALIRREPVSIVLDLPVPSGDQPVVAFGTAGGLVHPATGYSVAASLRAAPRLAAAVRAAFERRAGPAATARAAWTAVWPRWRRQARALERYGLEALLRFRRGEMQAFFESFFDQPAGASARYLAGEATPREVAVLMGGVFAGAPPSLRRRLVANDPRPLFRALG